MIPLLVKFGINGKMSSYAFNMSTKALTSFVVADYCNI
jgi:hypothetical protein